MKKEKYIKYLVSRILISIIIVLIIGIIIKVDIRNKDYLDKYIFKDHIKWTKINNWSKNKLGNILPEINNPSSLVFKNDNLENISKVSYLDGVKIDYSKNEPVSALYGGIVVFVGEKEGYNKVVIVQGNDGIDYWYGNMSDISINLYDYIEKETIIGNTSDDYLYLVLYQDGNKIDYDEYIKENKD